MPVNAPGDGFDYPRPAIEAAGRAAMSASDQARGIDLAGAVDGIAAALPGSSAAGAGDRLASSWQRGMQGWCDDMTRHGEALQATSTGMSQVDDTVGSNLAGIFGPLLGSY